MRYDGPLLKTRFRKLALRLSLVVTVLAVFCALGAFLGLHATAMHVDRIASQPSEWKYGHPIKISEGQYQELCSYIRKSFDLDSQGRVRPIPSPGYGSTDTFYEAASRYSAVNTCNTWTGRALSQAGVRVGRWTPLPWSVTSSIPDS